jgi:lysyl-tRNA synthetase, class I
MDATPERYPLLDHLAGYAVAYYDDFIKPTKKFRRPTEAERKALIALEQELAKASSDATAEELQNIVYETGKAHGFADNLRAWFQAIYEVLFGQSQGPRFGSFIALYGVAETRALIAKALKGELVTG